MAGESRFRSWLSKLTQSSAPQSEVVEQNVNGPTADGAVNEFNTQLGASYLNLIGQTGRGPAPYSVEQVMKMAREPMLHIQELRHWSRWAYYANGTVTTAIDTLVSLHSLDYIVVARPKKAGQARKSYRQSLDKMHSVLRAMRYKEVIRDALFHDANEGMYVGYMETRTVPVDHRMALTDIDITNITEINSAGVNATVIPLPVEYVRIIGRRNNCYEVAFDLRYFDGMIDDERKRKLQGFPRQIQDGWETGSFPEMRAGCVWIGVRPL